MQAAMMATSARLRLISLGLIVGGLALAIGPAALIRGLDNYVSRTRERDVDRWTELDGSATLPSISGPVIEPGPEGYLLEIPKIGVRVIVHTLEPEALLGRNTPLLKRHGVGQIPPTDDLRNVSPGAAGMAAVAGHRTTSGAPFRFLDRLSAGDQIIIRKRGVEQRWEVVSTTTVRPTAIDAIRSHPGPPQLVLLACSPPFSARERLLVYAKLVPGGGDSSRDLMSNSPVH